MDSWQNALVVNHTSSVGPGVDFNPTNAHFRFHAILATPRTCLVAEYLQMGERSRAFIDKMLFFCIERLRKSERLHPDRPLTIESARRYVENQSMLTLALVHLEGNSKLMATRQNFQKLPSWLEHCLISTFVERNVDRHFFHKKFECQLKARGYTIETGHVQPQEPAKRIPMKVVPSFDDIEVLQEKQADVLLAARFEGPLTETEELQLKKYKFLKLVKTGDDVLEHWQLYSKKPDTFHEVRNSKRRSWQQQLLEDQRIPHLLQPICNLMPRAGKRLKLSEELARGLEVPSLFGLDTVLATQETMLELDSTLDLDLAASAEILIKPKGRFPPFVQALRAFGLKATLKKTKINLPSTCECNTKQMKRYLQKWCPEILQVQLKSTDLRKRFRAEVHRRRSRLRVWHITNKHYSLYESFMCDDWRA